MLPLLTKHTVITAALMASLSLTACGKKTEGVVAPPPAAPTEGAKTAEAPKADKKGADTNGTLGSGLPDPKSQEDDYHPPLPEPGALPKTPKAPVITAPPAPPLKTKPAVKAPVAPIAKPPIVEEVKPAVKTPGTLIDVNKVDVPDTYKSANPKFVETENIAKRFTGGAGPDGLLYTSSSTDTLMSFLRARNSKVDFTSRKMNLEAAASVVAAKMSVDPSSQDAVVTLKIKEGAEVKTYVMAGSLAEGESSRLYKVRSGDSAPGLRALEGTVKCMDLDGGCQTTFVRLKIGSVGSSAIINVVFRQSAADVHVDFAKEQSGNGEFINFKDFLKNAILGVQHIDNKLKEARMSSYEVVNGKSEVTLSLKGYNDELIAFNAPLLSPEVGSGLSVTMSRVAKINDDFASSLLLDGRPKLNYANTIGSARLVANNGLGQVKTVLKMRQNSNFGQDQIAITFMRKIKPLMDLTEENMK